MNKKWIISVLCTLAIWGAGIFAFIHIKESVPKKLSQPSIIAVAENKYEKKEETSPELKEIIHKSQKLVVQIETEDGTLGSGFLYNNKGDIVTNAHVVANAKEVKVKTADSKEFTGTVIGVSNNIDVALVRVPELSSLQPLKVAKNRKAEVGDEVLALGSPLGLQNTVTTGIISGVGRTFDLQPFRYENVYQISAPIAPGNSGGPLVDSKTGEVLGINSAGYDQGSIGFSIPIPNVISLIEEWSEHPMTKLPEIVFVDNAYAHEEGDSFEEMAERLVSYFYENINYGDYVTAYSLLGSSWKSKISYEKFRNGYLDTLSVTVDDMNARQQGDTVSVTAVITAEERKNDGISYAKYKLNYEIGYENDELKILTGKGEEIK
ncbi:MULTISPECIES: S1C family serine protease [Anoxybacillaceae]|jgi:serine protease Do|uniref:S1C family serine protease n=1 Tax=Anoxybacillaceae TaxID=3120669 RepID=UPI000F25A408|nr:trypsin-like peptidase domain-containing protein [Parageobacillus toebii]